MLLIVAKTLMFGTFLSGVDLKSKNFTKQAKRSKEAGQRKKRVDQKRERREQHMEASRDWVDEQVEAYERGEDEPCPTEPYPKY